MSSLFREKKEDSVISTFQMKNGLLLLGCLLTFCFSKGQSPCGEILNPAEFPFFHGVASGDATQDAVIIWTRITPDQPITAATVHWTIATDSGMTVLVQEGEVMTGSSKDFTVKVDVQGLDAGQWYYYQFDVNGFRSRVGRTRTLPATGFDPFRVAVFSCANYQKGYFNVYREAGSRNDLQAVLHLGDYYYEYPSGIVSAFIQNRSHNPTNELRSLSDYRGRHAQMKTDPDLKLLHQQYPWYMIWDDHEIANDFWKGGAPGHNEAVLGPWEDRRDAAIQAYFEWMPIRGVNNFSIRRSLKIGDLARLYLWDVRVEGRDAPINLNDPNINDPNRTMLGVPQRNWLIQEFSNSEAIWNVVGNQVIFTPTIGIFGTPLDNDTWDGFPAERNWLLQQLQLQNLENFIVLSGDFHASWGLDIPFANYDRSAKVGSAGCEFVTSAVTSDPHIVPNPNDFMDLNPQLQFLDQTHRGYMIADFESDSVYVEWRHILSVTNPDNTTHLGAVASVREGSPFVNVWPQASEKIAPTNPVPLAAVPENPNEVRGLTTDFELGTVFPNPGRGTIHINYAAMCDRLLDWTIFDLKGRAVQMATSVEVLQGKRDILIDPVGLPAGVYLLQVEVEGDLFFRKLVLR